MKSCVVTDRMSKVNAVEIHNQIECDLISKKELPMNSDKKKFLVWQSLF